MTNSEYISVTQLIYVFQQIHTIPNPKLYPIYTKNKIPLSKHSHVPTNLQTLKYKFKMVNLNNTLMTIYNTFTVHLLQHIQV